MNDSSFSGNPLDCPQGAGERYRTAAVPALFFFSSFEVSVGTTVDDGVVRTVFHDGDLVSRPRPQWCYMG